jgi:hypothetical protein
MLSISDVQLDVKGNGDSQLMVRGPVGAKVILLEEFPKTR